jgi:hypothetical protein
MNLTDPLLFSTFQSKSISSGVDLHSTNKAQSMARLSEFFLPCLNQHRNGPFGKVVPEHLLSCSETFICQYPCPYESSQGFNKYLYLDGSIYSNERIKLGDENLIVKHELRSQDKYMRFVDYSEICGEMSPFVGKEMASVRFKKEKIG